MMEPCGTVRSSPENLRMRRALSATRSTVPRSVVPMLPTTRTTSPAWRVPSAMRKTPARRSRIRYCAPNPSVRPSTVALASTGVTLTCTASSIRMSAVKMMAYRRSPSMMGVIRPAGSAARQGVAWRRRACEMRSATQAASAMIASHSSVSMPRATSCGSLTSRRTRRRGSSRSTSARLHGQRNAVVSGLRSPHARRLRSAPAAAGTRGRS